MFQNPLRGGQFLANAPVSSKDKAPQSAPSNYAVESYRIASIFLVAASIIIAAVLAFATGVRVNSEGTDFKALALATLLIAAHIWRSASRLTRVADFFSTFALTSLAGTSCGAIAMLGLRLHFPLADSMLATWDRTLGLDPLTAVRWLLSQGQSIFTLMVLAYNQTIPILGLSMILLALIGNRLEAWRGVFCFTGCLLSICLIAMFIPAKGLGVWAPDELMEHLPDQAMRYFWTNFDKFYGGPDPVLRIDTIDGVISFPSFHAVMGFITLAMWRKNLTIFVLVGVWLTFMLLATMPCGGHYAVDLIAAFVLWGAWFTLSRRMEVATVPSLSATMPGDAIGN